jgi:hypothetical protein
MMTRSSTAPEIAQVYARAPQLATQTGQAAELFTAVWGSCNVAVSGADLITANRLIDELFDIARGQDDAGLLLQAHHAAWAPAMISGDLVLSRKHVEAGLSLYRQASHRRHAHIYGGHDPGECAYTPGAFVTSMLGYPDEAIRQIDQGMALARLHILHRWRIQSGLRLRFASFAENRTKSKS